MNLTRLPGPPTPVVAPAAVESISPLAWDAASPWLELTQRPVVAPSILLAAPRPAPLQVDPALAGLESFLGAITRARAARNASL
jgi:hypothetical protein